MTKRVLMLVTCAAAMAIPCDAQSTPPTPPQPPTRLDSVSIAARRAAMISDLRNFVVAQEAYFADNGTYAGRMKDLSNYRTSNGVSVIILSASKTGHTAIATYRDTIDLTCAVGAGRANPFGEGEEGRVICRMPDGSMYPPASPPRLAPDAASR
jgi:hypothetical protein